MLFALPLLSACTFAGRSATPVPPRGAAPPNLVAVHQQYDEMMQDLPKGTLSSEASLIAIEDERACADVVIRASQAAGPVWKVSAIVDGDDDEEQTWVPFACEYGRCFAGPPRIAPRATDASWKVKVVGGRLCVPLRAAPSRDVVLRVRQGVARFEFAWALAQQR
jgi:hypothetical protein